MRKTTGITSPKFIKSIKNKCLKKIKTSNQMRTLPLTTKVSRMILFATRIEVIMAKASNYKILAKSRVS